MLSWGLNISDERELKQILENAIDDKSEIIRESANFHLKELKIETKGEWARFTY